MLTRNFNLLPTEQEFNETLREHLILALCPFPVMRYNEVNIEGREGFLASFYFHMALHAPTRDAYCN